MKKKNNNKPLKISKGCRLIWKVVLLHQSMTSLLTWLIEQSFMLEAIKLHVKLKYQFCQDNGRLENDPQNSYNSCTTSYKCKKGNIEII